MHMRHEPVSARYLDRRQWNRFLFYTDLVVIAVFAVSMVLVVVNAYSAGYQFRMAEYGASNTALWKVVTATGFLTGSLAWIFFRFFKNQYMAMQKPY